MHCRRPQMPRHETRWKALEALAQTGRELPVGRGNPSRHPSSCGGCTLHSWSPSSASVWRQRTHAHMHTCAPICTQLHTCATRRGGQYYSGVHVECVECIECMCQLAMFISTRPPSAAERPNAASRSPQHLIVSSDEAHERFKVKLIRQTKKHLIEPLIGTGTTRLMFGPALSPLASLVLEAFYPSTRVRVAFRQIMLPCACSVSQSYTL